MRNTVLFADIFLLIPAFVAFARATSYFHFTDYKTRIIGLSSLLIYPGRVLFIRIINNFRLLFENLNNIRIFILLYKLPILAQN
jgi:hypothetical protein